MTGARQDANCLRNHDVVPETARVLPASVDCCQPQCSKLKITVKEPLSWKLTVPLRPVSDDGRRRYRHSRRRVASLPSRHLSNDRASKRWRMRHTTGECRSVSDRSAESENHLRADELDPTDDHARRPQCWKRANDVLQLWWMCMHVYARQG